MKKQYSFSQTKASNLCTIPHRLEVAVDAMLKQPNCPFVLYVGSKKLVKRKEFEAYISSKLII